MTSLDLTQCSGDTVDSPVNTQHSTRQLSSSAERSVINGHFSLAWQLVSPTVPDTPLTTPHLSNIPKLKICCPVQSTFLFGFHEGRMYLDTDWKDKTVTLFWTDRIFAFLI